MVAPRADGLGTRGAAVFRALSGTKPDAARKALAMEAGRMADRLEHLDEAIRNQGPYRVLPLDEEDASTLTLVVDRAMAEARQLQLAYTTVVKTLAAPAAAAAKPAPEPKKDPVDDIAARRAARRAAAGS